MEYQCKIIAYHNQRKHDYGQYHPKELKKRKQRINSIGYNYKYQNIQSNIQNWEEELSLTTKGLLRNDEEYEERAYDKWVNMLEQHLDENL